MKFMEKVNTFIAYIAMAALFLMMCLTTVDTILRKTTHGGVTDSLDFTERFMLLFVFGGLAFLESKGWHLRVDMLLTILPKIVKRVIQTLIYLLSTGIICLFAYGMYRRLNNDLLSGAATQLLKVPTWPFTVFVLFCILLYAVTMIVRMIYVATGGEEEAHVREG